MLDVARTGASVWWRRGGFHEQAFRGVEPKWHILSGRTTKPAGHGEWLAKCGYTRDFSEQIMLDFPKLSKAAPKKSTRCLKCVSEPEKP